jgi:hypothetical protein
MRGATPYLSPPQNDPYVAIDVSFTIRLCNVIDKPDLAPDGQRSFEPADSVSLQAISRRQLRGCSHL